MIETEYKSFQQTIEDISDRTVAGIFAVHGVIDSGQDRSHPGAFAKTIRERLTRIRYLWGHEFNAPPIAVIKSIEEVGREALPASIRDRFPEASGGVRVVREYLDTPRANEVLEGIKSGAISELSYGYDAIKIDFETIDGVKVRNLREVRLWEISDVNFGMNPATLAAAKHLEATLRALKEGRRHSEADLELLNQIHDATVALGCSTCPLSAFKADGPEEIKGGIDETGDSFRYRLRDSEEFVAESFRTITLQQQPVIRAVIGKLRSDPGGATHLQTLVFPKDAGWTRAKVERWVNEHRDELAGKSLMSRAALAALTQAKLSLQALELSNL